MRPQILYPLFAAVETLPGIGTKTAKLIDRVAGNKVVDLLWHLPSGIVDRRYRPSVAEALPGSVATLTVTVDGLTAPATRRGPYRVRCHDATGTIDLVFFHAGEDWLSRMFPVGEDRVVSGRVEQFQGQPQMAHPDRIGTQAEMAAIATVEPVYPLTAGLAPKIIGRAIAATLDLAPELPEWQDPAWLARQHWPAWRAALLAAHHPDDMAALGLTGPARARLAFDELLANQLALALVRASVRRQVGRATQGDGRLRRQVVEALAFGLTGSQRRALTEIETDMAASHRMMRLLQGDVGSGKTVVALLAMLIAVEAGGQATMLAPTEILARQHLQTLRPWAEAAGVEIAVLTGRDKGAARRGLLDRIAEGAVPLVVGTHALLEDDVAFRDLRLAVIDEQHRFGVHQRLRLATKGRAVDVLVMTATPIPRTLQLTAYGDMDGSQLTEKPPGRQPVDTRALPNQRLAEVVEALTRKLDGGEKAYWVCPLVEESETGDLAAATERYETLRSRFGDRVGLVHGRLKAAEKDAVMSAFVDGPIDLLVATTVIEVGVDVPAATVMVIEHAERFGLAQLHQLRGRIGRGDKPSVCLLLYAPPLGETARARIAALRDTDDGFRIAEEDLRLRGAGEVLGTRQSGLPTFRMADLAAHADLLAAARDDAKLILDRDPHLEAPRGAALRVLLYLFERDAAVRYLRSG